MPEPEEATVSRRYLSQIGIRLPFFGDIVLFDNISTARQLKRVRRKLLKAPKDAGLRLSLANLLVSEGRNEEALAEWMKARLELPFDEDVQDDENFSAAKRFLALHLWADIVQQGCPG